jgi:hypothetical protein
MERNVANSVVTRAFCMVTPAIRSRVHFFPSAGTTAGHYPVSCELTLFGKGIERRSVRLEGGRLNQPDGIRLEDAFPALENEGSGLCGLEIVFECPQGRINLSNSRLVVEIVSPQFSLSYGAAPFQPTFADTTDGEVAAHACRSLIGVALQDGSATPSVVVVNSTTELLRPEFRHSARDGDSPLQLGTVAPNSVVEFPLDEALCKNAEERETLWGAAVIEKMWGTSNWGLGGTVCYMLHRDPVSKRPISVCAL